MLTSFYNKFSKISNVHKFLVSSIILNIISYPTGPFLPDFFLITTLIFFLYHYKKISLTEIFKSPIFYFFIIFFLFLIIRSFFVVEFFVSIKSSLFYFRFFFYSICFFFLFRDFKKFAVIIYWTTMIVLLFVLIDTYVQYLFEKDLFGYPRHHTRLSGPFGDELIVGSYIAKITPFLFSIYFLINKKLNFYHLVLLTLSWVIVFLSGERTSFFYLSIVMISFLLFYKAESNSKQILLLLFLSIISFGIASQDKTAKNRMVQHTLCTMNIKFFDFDCSRTADESTIKKKRIVIFSSSHEGHYLAAFKMFKDNIVFGVGPKMYRFYCKDDRYYNKHSCTTHPHNTLLQILAELGLIGLGFYLTAIFYLLINFHKFMFKNKKISKNHKFSIILIYISFFQTFFFLVPSGQFFNNYLSIINYLPLGLFLYYIKIYKSE